MSSRSEPAGSGTMEGKVAADIVVAMSLLAFVVAIAAIWWHAKTHGTDGPEQGAE